MKLVFNKMKTIYLHIGLGKTGTTTIQRYMARNCKYFNNTDIRYIHTGGGSKGIGHQNFAKSFIKDIPYYMVPPQNIDNNRRAILKEIEDRSELNFLLSSENFQLADPEEIKCFFNQSKILFSYKIILFVRSQNELLESEYNQLIKVRVETRSLYEYLRDSFDGNFMDLGLRWEKVFGKENLIFKIYDASKTNILNEFLSCLPLSPYQKGQCPSGGIEFSNRSLGLATLSLKRMLNILRTESHNQLHFELPEELNGIFSGIDPSAILMDSTQSEKIRKSFKDINERFSERYLGKKLSDLGGRKYSDAERNNFHEQYMALMNIAGFEY